MGSRGGAKTTVQRFTLIFLLPLAEEYSRTLPVLKLTRMTGKGSIVYRIAS